MAIEIEATHTESSRGRLGPSLILGLAALGLVGAYVFFPERLQTVAGLSTAMLAAATGIAAIVTLRSARGPSAWGTARHLALALGALTGVLLLFVVYEVRGSTSPQPGALDIVFLILGLLFLIPIVIEYREHFLPDDRREISADVVLMAIAFGTIVYLFLRPSTTDLGVSVSSAVFALIVSATLAAYGALALWAPSTAHLGQLAAIGALSSAVLTFGDSWVRGVYAQGQAAIDLPMGLGALFLAFLVVIVPAHVDPHGTRIPRYGRPILTTIAVAAATAGLGLVASMETDGRVGVVHASVLIAVLGVGVAIRVLVNQVRSTKATAAVEEALGQREAALRETDKALARLQRANETLRESEERLRLVFEAAVDGIVELDDRDVIVRANEAFCRMMELPHSTVEGQPWTALAAAIAADDSFATLPTNGQGTLRRQGQAVYLEARVSEIPGDPPRRLILVRDVTAARVADQTIRSLFKFLQDRDEDRTRIMRRTNAAIESERNRIARDLHDGPVQGVSAASLSLEAVLLMLKAGDIDEALEVLSKVREELSDEADNLRTLMSGLRPPLLEERGLVPALRETVDRFGRDNALITEFYSRAVVEVPQDLETLAYRVVQEALSNVGKHAGATRLAVAVEAVAGQLKVEVTDDGVGFDSAQAREYLRMGRVGLASMRERVELANGTFMVHSTPDRGTTVMATLPLEAVPAPRELAINDAAT